MLKPFEESGPATEMAVANGRCVDQPVPGERRIAGFDSSRNEYVYAATQKRFYPGEVVTLPASEALRLKQLGFLVEVSEYKPPLEVRDGEARHFGVEPTT
jgi:hypothetical protein